MRAAVLRAVSQPLSVEEVELADPGAHEVVVRVAAAGLCRSDVHFMQGEYEVPLPAVLGHESAGVVEAVGDAVTYVQPGDHVVTCLTVFCGQCRFCQVGAPAMCVDRAATARRPGQRPRISQDGAEVHQYLHLSSFAEQMLVHESALVRVDPELPLEQAALLGCGVTTGMGAVMNTARVRAGQAVAVIGCGGVGLSAIQAARISGASPIVAVDRIDAKLEMAARLGATHVANSATQNVAEVVWGATDGAGVDHAFEAVGIPAMVELAFSLLDRGGTVTVVGVMSAGATIAVAADGLFHERKIQGSNMGSTRHRLDIPRYARMYMEGRLDLDGMITNRYDLADINRGFEEMLTGRVARNIVVMG